MKLGTLFTKRRTITTAAVAIALPITVWVIGAVWQVATHDPDTISDAASLYDTEGRFVAAVGSGRQAYVPFEEISPPVRQATVAIEDSRFYRHFGIDPRGIIRSIWVDLRAGGRVQGASTITQQLARNLYLSREKTIVRKIKEAIYAVLLEMRYTKNRILELYLNTVYFGEGAHGIEAAAFTYFGKSASQLNLAESAMIVGLLKAPHSLSPYRNPKEAIERRNVVLARMEELGYITATQKTSAQKVPLKLAKRRGGQAPYFVDYITAQLVDRFGSTAVYQGGLRVVTTLNLKMQAAARDALGEVQGAVVAVDVRSGGIVAMVGGRDYIESQFNRATQALRQPGSAFKPFVYAAALERGWSMNRTLIDHPGNFRGYEPQNFKGEYWGQVTLKQALTRSLNTASVRLLQQIGVGPVIDMARRLGITTLVPDDRNLALALGGITRGVTPISMAAAYSPFANGGLKHDSYAIEQVTDRNGKLLYRHRAKPKRVISPEVAYLMTNMLQNVIEKGTGTAANIGRPQAGKTGTTNDSLSAWFVGYTPQIAAAVYIGNDTRKPLAGGGGSIAAPIWGRFAVKALADMPVEGFAVPPSIQTNIPVDVFSGLIAGPSCRLQELDAFVVGTAPINAAPCYWNAAAQPQPYRIGTGPQPLQPGSTFAQLPGGLFGDDPAIAPTSPGSLPASLAFPWERSPLLQGGVEPLSSGVSDNPTEAVSPTASNTNKVASGLSAPTVNPDTAATTPTPAAGNTSNPLDSSAKTEQSTPSALPDAKEKTNPSNEVSARPQPQPQHAPEASAAVVTNLKPLPTKTPTATATPVVPQTTAKPPVNAANATNKVKSTTPAAPARTTTGTVNLPVKTAQPTNIKPSTPAPVAANPSAPAGTSSTAANPSTNKTAPSNTISANTGTTATTPSNTTANTPVAVDAATQAGADSAADNSAAGTATTTPNSSTMADEATAADDTTNLGGGRPLP